MNKFGCGGAQVKYQQRHGYSENAVAQGSESFDALSADLIVAELLPMESAQSRRRVHLFPAHPAIAPKTIPVPRTPT